MTTATVPVSAPLATAANLANVPAIAIAIGKASRNVRGDLAAQTDIPMDGGRVLRVTTAKRSGKGISTFATVGNVSSCNGFDCFSFMMSQDYSVRLINDLEARASEKAVNAQHAAALADPAALIAAANAFYAGQASPE